MNLQSTIKFCGKWLDIEALLLIKELAEDFWGISQTELANTVCELLDWKRPNGKLKTVECRQFLQDLGERGVIGIPRKRAEGKLKNAPVAYTSHSSAGEEISGSVGDLGGAVLHRVQGRRELGEWKELVDRYHYLGYRQPFGAQLRYLVRCAEREQIVGCLQYSSPAWKVEARDRWIGWEAKQREAGLQRIVQNSRFLILPWIKVKGLASHILGRARRCLAGDWEKLYGYRPYLLETFVEERFKGTCYRAANWIELGQTQGRGRMDRTHRCAEPKKTVWVYPLRRDARKWLRRSES